MDQLRPRLFSGLGAAVLLAALVGSPTATLAKSPGITGDVRTVANGGTINPTTGDFTSSGAGDVATGEFPGVEDEDGADPYEGTIDRSLSNGSGHGASVNTGQKAKSNPTQLGGFEGLNHYQQRYSRGGNQFSIEPPDQ